MSKYGQGGVWLRGNVWWIRYRKSCGAWDNPFGSGSGECVLTGL